MRRSAITALIVGQVLAVINHGDKIWAGAMSTPDWLKIALTFAAPYSVSTIASVLALKEQHRLHAEWFAHHTPD